MKIPNSDHAIADIRKLKEYSLNTEHRMGKNKARVFASALGLKIEDAEVLREILIKSVQKYDAEVALKDVYGQRYQIDFPLEWKGRQSMVRSTWIIEPNMPYPKLTSCYVLKKQ